MKKVFSLLTIALMLANLVIPIGVYGYASDRELSTEIFVERVTGMREDFIRGVDIGSIIAQENSGVTYYNWDGVEQDIFQTLAEAGVNLVRIRIWNDPFDENGNGFGGGNNDVEAAIEIGRRATEQGMGVQLNFHYSDFWADPGKQQSPRAWMGMNLEERAEALHNFTYDSVRKITDAGVDVWQVQIGNETNSAMAGVSGWNNMIPLFRAGSEAVRAIDEEIQIVIHFTNPENPGHFMNAAQQLATAGIDYDVFGASYYAFWHGSLDNLTTVLSNVANTFDVDVMVVETSYVHTIEDGDGHANVVPNDTQTLDYPISVQGQVNAVRDVFQAVADVGSRGLGVIYWEPAWIPVGPASEVANNRLLWELHGSGWASSFAAVYDPYDAGVWYGGSAWDNQALFDFNGHPLASLNIFNYIQTGAMPADGITIETVMDETAQIEYFTGITATDVIAEVTQTVQAVYIDNSRRLVPVEWSITEIQNVLDIMSSEGGIQTFHINGTVVDEATGRSFNAVLGLTILPFNMIENYSFESADMSMWRIGFNEGNGANRGTDNPRSGSYGLRFWHGSTLDFYVEQDIEIEVTGSYVFEMFLQGGDGSNRNIYIYVDVNGEPRYNQSTDLGGWMNWSNPVINDIWAEEGDIVTIGVRLQSGGGVWGTFDDFYFYLVDRYDEIVEMPTLTLEPATVAINNENLTATSVVSGTATGDIELNISDLPSGVSAVEENGVITVTGIRPNARTTSIEGTFIVPVMRGDITESLLVDVHLTPQQELTIPPTNPDVPQQESESPSVPTNPTLPQTGINVPTTLTSGLVLIGTGLTIISRKRRGHLWKQK